MTDITTWLGALGLAKYASSFEASEVDLAALVHLTDDDLRDLGLPLGPRRKILAAIREQAAAPSPKQQSGGIPPGERRVVAVLFVDLVGYTSLSRSLDAEELHGLLQRFFATVDGIVEEHGGRVDKHIGDCVMAVFGAPTAHGNDPERAVRAALAIRTAMVRLSADLQRPILVHIGLASGQVVASGTGSESHSEYTVTGETVNLASRLADAAGASEILASDSLWQGLAHALDGASVALHNIEGLPGPVPAWRITGWRGGGQRAHPLIGRRLELEQLRLVLDVCRETGRGRSVLIRGEAGIGKTRLLEEALSIAHDGGFRRHVGLVLDFGTGANRNAIQLLAGAIIGVDRDRSPEAALAAVAAARTRGLIEDEDVVFVHDLVGAQQPREMRALYDAMDNLAREAGARRAMTRLVARAGLMEPMVLAVEDVHWADHSTLAHLAALAATVSDCPVVLIMTTRPEQDPINRSWLAQAGASPLIIIDLSPLHHEEAALLAAPFLAATTEVAQQCIERAAGNPLFLEQLLRHAIEGESSAVPGSIQSLVQARLDRLEPSAKAALQAASVLGQRFDRSALAHVLDQPDYSPERLLQQLMIRQQGSDFLFSHALIRDAVYSGLLKSRQRELHRRAADWFANRDAQLRAEHLDRADASEAARAYLQAATAEGAKYRYDAARRLVERGFELARTEADRFALACLKGEILHDLGEMPAALQAFEAALQAATGDSDRCRVWIGRAKVKRVTDDLDGAFADLESAEAVAVSEGLKTEEARLRFLRGNLYFPRGNIDGCLREHGLSLELAREAGAPEHEAAALGGLGDAEYVRGRMASAYDRLSACVELARRHGFGRIEVANKAQIAHTMLYLRPQREALDHACVAAASAAQVGHLRGELNARVAALFAFHALCDWEACGEEVERARVLVRRLGAWRFEQNVQLADGRVALAQGRRREAAEVLRLAAEGASRTGIGFHGPVIQSALAVALENADERRKAIAEGEAIIRQGCVGHNQLRFYPDAIDVSLELSDWGEAERYSAALEAYTRAEPLPWSEFFVARGRALAAVGRGLHDLELLTEVTNLLRRAQAFGYEFATQRLASALARIGKESA